MSEKTDIIVIPMSTSFKDPDCSTRSRSPYSPYKAGPPPPRRDSRDYGRDYPPPPHHHRGDPRDYLPPPPHRDDYYALPPRDPRDYPPPPRDYYPPRDSRDYRGDYDYRDYGRRRPRSRSPDDRRRGSRSPPRRRFDRPPRRHISPSERGTPEPCKVLGVFGLSILTKERDLEKLFGQYGRITHVTIIEDKISAKSRGFGFITFESIEDAAKAREALNGYELNDRKMRVDYSLTKKKGPEESGAPGNGAPGTLPPPDSSRPPRDDYRAPREDESRRSRSYSPGPRRERRRTASPIAPKMERGSKEQLSNPTANVAGGAPGTAVSPSRGGPGGVGSTLALNLQAPSEDTTHQPAPTLNAPAPQQQATSAISPAAPAVGRSQTSLFEALAQNEPDYSGLSAKERKMAQRRCIAEDPEWNLAPVEKLSDLCVKVIVANFEKSPQLQGVPEKYRAKVLDTISVDIPLTIAAPLIPDEAYWKRRATSKFKICDPSQHGGSWKRLFFELHIQQLCENFKPRKVGGQDEITELTKEIRLAAAVVESLDLKQLRPTEPAEGVVVKATDPAPDHLDVGLLFGEMTRLKHFKAYYGVRDCGMNFAWKLFGMTINDCINLTNSIKASAILESLTLQTNSIDDDRCRLIANALLDNTTLKKLDLSHNKISDSGARGLAKLLSIPTCPLTHLNLANNKIGPHGASSIGKSIQNNPTLEHLNIRMNYLTDEGGAALLAALVRSTNSTTGVSTCGLKSLDLSSNRLGMETVNVVCALLKRNGRVLTYLDLSCNKLGNVPSGSALAALTAPGMGIAGGIGGLPGSGAGHKMSISGPSGAAPAALGAAGVSGFMGSHITGRFGEGGKADTDAVGKMLFEAISLNKYVTHLDLRVTDLSQEHIVAIKGIIAENCQ
ncbi:T-complex-associated testis-expressed protein 1 [Chytridiales sp. JEL 0842]|nr:T-complex-associated testis-expressed protein 1 [Chytridiales sp. JEL 0842]